MSLFHILFGSQIAKGFVPDNPDGTGALGLELDVVVSESPSYKATPTKSPVESGAKITDHVLLEPLTLDIEGIVTLTPALPPGSLRGLISPNAVADAHKYLKRLREKREPFTFVGSLEVYENMILTSYNPGRTSKNGTALEFHATMEQIVIVTGSEAPILNFKAPEGNGGTTKGNRGHQPTSEAPLKLGTGAGSVLSQWFPNLLQ